MKLLSTLTLLTMALVSFANAGELKIEWTDPDEFRDADYYYNGGDKSKDLVLSNLEKFFTRKARSSLPEGSVLEMKVTELDLAGDFEPWRGPSLDDVRIVKSIYPARIEFDYKYMGSDGTVIKEGSEVLKDMLIPDSLSARMLGRSENYPYVKTLVKDWMRKIARK